MVSLMTSYISQCPHFSYCEVFPCSVSLPSAEHQISARRLHPNFALLHLFRSLGGVKKVKSSILGGSFRCFFFLLYFTDLFLLLTFCVTSSHMRTIISLDSNSYAFPSGFNVSFTTAGNASRKSSN